MFRNHSRGLRGLRSVGIAAGLWAVCAAYSITIPVARAAALQDGPKSVTEGVYSAAQATRGEGLYGQECGSCHGPNLAGAEAAPALTGPEFVNEWSGQTVADLLDRIAASMPADAPGRLSRQQYADIVALILKSNDYPAGSADLATDSAALKQIAIKTK